MLSHFIPVGLFETLWTVAHQTPLSMGFSSQEYWSGLSRPPPGDIPDPQTELISLYVYLLCQNSSLTLACNAEDPGLIPGSGRHIFA